MTSGVAFLFVGKGEAAASGELALEGEKILIVFFGIDLTKKLSLTSLLAAWDERDKSRGPFRGLILI